MKGTINVREDMQGPLRQVQETARRIAKITQECKVNIDVEEYVGKFKSSLIDLVYPLLSIFFFSLLFFHNSLYNI